MRPGFCLVIFFLWSLLLPPTAACAASEPLLPQVDERAELLGVVFHLAGNPEYNEILMENYARDIGSYFAPFKQHPAVLAAAQLRSRRGVAFNAPMAMALDLSAPPALLPPVIPFSDSVPEYRFGKIAASDFASQLKSFYSDTRFADFYRAHQQIYQDEERATLEMLKGFDLDWFARFFNYEGKINFHAVISLTSGDCNYGATNVFPDGRRDVYAVLGCLSDSDRKNMPKAARNKRNVLAHEFNHAFVNPLVDRNFGELEPAASEIFKYVEKQMCSMAYPSPKIMLYESLVHASQHVYDQSHEGQSKNMVDIRADQGRGFIWMDELYLLMSRYNSSRDKYPSLQSFMPEIKQFFQKYAASMKDKMEAYQSLCPKVSGLTPALNHTATVDPGLKELVVTFDKPLQPPYMSVCTTSGKDVYFPELDGMPQFRSENRQIVLRFQPLSPQRKYKILLSGMSFRSEDGYRLQDYEIEFATGK
jgi:hypothetical protein